MSWASELRARGNWRWTHDRGRFRPFSLHARFRRVAASVFALAAVGFISPRRPPASTSRRTDFRGGETCQGHRAPQDVHRSTGYGPPSATRAGRALDRARGSENEARGRRLKFPNPDHPGGCGVPLRLQRQLGSSLPQPQTASQVFAGDHEYTQNNWLQGCSLPAIGSCTHCISHRKSLSCEFGDFWPRP